MATSGYFTPEASCLFGPATETRPSRCRTPAEKKIGQSMRGLFCPRGSSVVWMLGVVLFCATEVAAAEQQEDKIAAILEAWLARQAEIHTLSVEWTADVYVPPLNEKEGGAFQVTGSLVIDESGRIRYEGYSVNRGRRGQDELNKQNATFVFDKTVRTKLYPKIDSGYPDGIDKGYPGAYITNGSTQSVARNVWLAAIFVAVRPLDNTYHTIPLASIRDSGARVEFQGERCMILDCGDHSLWVTDDPRHLLVRVYKRSGQSGLASSDTQISYERVDGLWMPMAWQTDQFQFGVGDSQLRQSRNAVVTSCSVNEKLPESTFEIELPDGTWVHNTITDESYILRKGRPNRPVLPGEYNGENYEQIKNSEPPSVSTPERTATRTWFLRFNIGFIALVVLIFVIRRLRSS